MVSNIELANTIKFCYLNALSKAKSTSKIIKQEKELSPVGFEFIGSNHENGETYSGYYGAAFANHETKEIIIASSGTKVPFIPKLTFDIIKNNIVNLAADLLNNFQILLTKVAPQLYYGMPSQFTDDALPFAKKIADEFKDYKIITTGHSLGATIAELIAVSLKKDGYNVEANTYEGAGSRHLADRISAENDDYSYVTSNLFHKNLFNSYGSEHIGKKIHMQSDHKQTWDDYFSFSKHSYAAVVKSLTEKDTANSNLPELEGDSEPNFIQHNHVYSDHQNFDDTCVMGDATEII